MSFNVLPGDNFVLEVTPNSMRFYQKTQDMQIKEIETFIPLTPTGLGSCMTKQEHLEYICRLPDFIERFGEEEVIKAIESKDFDFNDIDDSEIDLD